MSNPNKLGSDAKFISLDYPYQTLENQILTQDSRRKSPNTKPKRIILIIIIIIFLISMALIITKIRIFLFYYYNNNNNLYNINKNIFILILLIIIKVLGPEANLSALDPDVRFKRIGFGPSVFMSCCVAGPKVILGPAPNKTQL